MKRSFVKVALIAAAVGAMTAGTAYATPVLTIDGSAPTTFTGGGSSWVFLDTTADGWTISGTIADFSPSVAPRFDIGSFAATCVAGGGCSTKALTVDLSDTFTTPVGLGGFVTVLTDSQTGAGSVVQTATAAGKLIGTITCTATNSCSPGGGTVTGGGPAGPAPYTVSIDTVFTAVGTAGTTFSTDGDVRVPEPATFALFGAALLGCALFLGRRRLPNA